MARTRLRKWFRRSLWTTFGVALAVLLVVLFVQTPWGKNTVADLGAGFVSSRMDGRIEIGRVSGAFPFHMRVDTIRVLDSEGAFLAIDDLAIDVNAPALWRKRVHVESLELGQLTLHRRPVREEPPPLRIPDLPELPRWLRVDRAALPHVRLDEPVVGAAAAFTLQAHFLPPAGDGRWDLELAVERVDGDGTHMLVDADASPDALRLIVDVYDEVVLPELLDAEGPVVFRLEGDGPRAAWEGSIAARIGAEDALDGTLRLDAREDTEIVLEARGALNHPAIPADIASQFGEQGILQLTGTLDPSGLLTLTRLDASTSVAKLVIEGDVHLRGSQLDLSMEAYHEDPARIVRQDYGSLQPFHGTAALSGTLADLDVDLAAALGDAPLADAKARLDVSQGVRAEGSARLWPHIAFAPEAVVARFPEGIDADFDIARDREGRLTIARLTTTGAGARVDARGTLDPVAGTVDAEVQAALARIQEILQDEEVPVDGAVDATLTVRGDADRTAFDLRVAARDVTLPDGALPRVDLRADGSWAGGLGDDIHRITATLTAETDEGAYQSKPVPAFRIDGRVGAPQLDMVVIESLSATDGQSTLEVSGTYDTDRHEARMNARIEAPLQPYEAWLSDGIDGAITAAVGAAKAHDGPWEIDIDGEIAGLNGVPDAAQALLSPRATVTAEAAVGDGAAELRALLIESASLAARVEGNLDTTTKAVVLDSSADIADLATLQEAFNIELGGAARIAATVTGTVEAPDVRGKLTVNNPIAGPLEGRRAVAAFTYARDDGRTPRVSLEATLEPRGDGAPLELAGVAGFEPGQIDIPNATLAQGENRIAGTLTVYTEDQRADADLTVDAPDLASLAALATVDVQGRVAGTVRVTREGVAQAELSASDLLWEQLAIRRADVDITADDIFERPAGRAEIAVNQLATAQATVDTLSLRAEGDVSELRFAVEAAGALENETPVNATLTGDASFEERRFRLADLTGAFGEYPVALHHATTLEAHGDGWTLQPLALTIGAGSIEAAGTLASDAVDLRGRVNDLPLSMLRLAGAPEAEGRASGSLTILGTGLDPQGQLDLQLEDVRRSDSGRDVPPGDVRVTATLAPDRLQGAIDVAAQDLLEARGNAAMPIAWQVWPWRFEALESAPLQGEVVARGDLAALPSFLVLPDHKIAGRIDAQLALGGTRGRPDVRGDGGIREGRYENVATGTILSNISADLAGEATTLRLVRLEAGAGPEGSVSAEGHVAFVTGEPLAIDLAIALRNARVVHRDDATARATGDLRFHGTPQELQVDGDVQLGPADIALPEPSGERIPELAFTEINVPEGRAAELAAAERDRQEPGIIRLGIHVSAPGRVYVRGRGLDSEWRGDVNLVGTAGAPAVTGSLGIVRGHINLLGRRFEFEDSTIVFNGKTPPDPYLNLNAVASAGDVTARLAMTGTLDTLDLALSSDPPLPRDEILARVLFGKSLAQISPLQAVRLATAAATLTGRVDGLPFLAGAGRLAAFDRIEIRQGETVEETALGIGHYIGEDIYVEVEKGVGPDSGRARVEVELTPQISLEAEAGADRRQGVGLFWKRDY